MHGNEPAHAHVLRRERDGVIKAHLAHCKTVVCRAGTNPALEIPTIAQTDENASALFAQPQREREGLPYKSGIIIFEKVFSLEDRSDLESAQDLVRWIVLNRSRSPEFSNLFRHFQLDLH